MQTYRSWPRRTQMNQRDYEEAVYHFFRKTGGHSFCGGMCADVKTHDNQ